MQGSRGVELAASILLHLSASILLHHPLPVEWVVYVPSPEQFLFPGGCEGARQLPGPVPAHSHQVGMVGDAQLLAQSCCLLLADPGSSAGAGGEVEGGRGSGCGRGARQKGLVPNTNENTMQMSRLQQVALIRCCQMNSASLQLSPALASRSEALICSRCGLIYCDLANYCN